MPRPVGNRHRRHRPGNAITLGQIAAQVHQQQALLGFFHTLGDHLALKSLGQADHASNDGQIFGIVEHVAHEALVDFENIDRQALEVGQR